MVPLARPRADDSQNGSPVKWCGAADSAKPRRLPPSTSVARGAPGEGRWKGDGGAHRIVEVEALALGGNVGEIQVVAPHLELILHEHLAVGHAVRVPDVFEVRNSLRSQATYGATSGRF